MRHLNLTIGTLFMLQTTAFAGNLDNGNSPAFGSGMPSTTAIYNQLDTGAAISIPGAFQEPSAGPAATGKTLADIRDKLPVADNASGATPEQVFAGKSYWSLRTDGTWGVQAGLMAFTGTATAGDVLEGSTFYNTNSSKTSGTMTNNRAVTITPGSSVQSIAAGYHNGFGTVVGDTNLKAVNIKAGTTVFGVTGTLKGGYTCTGTLNGTRWCDNGDGTVRDMTTGLIWLQDANCPAILAGVNKTGDGSETDKLSWHDAGIWSSNMVNGVCELWDGSSSSDWRLPTAGELYTLANGTEPVRYDSPRNFLHVQAHYYWSSNTKEDNTLYALTLDAVWGYTNYGFKEFKGYYVWPVRSGQ